MSGRLAVLAMAATIAAGAVASESYTPPEGGSWQMSRLYLKPVGPFGEATGVAVFACNLAETQHRVQVYVTGVRAGALYTMWLVKMDGNKVVGTYEVTSRWRPVHADVNGVLSFVGNLPWCPMGHDAFVVKYHPDGERKGFWDGVTVLKGYLKTMD